MPVISHLPQLATRSQDIISEPLIDAKFTLDSSGVAGFFGGDSAVSGMATVNLIPNRRWGGWYNSPGSYEIAKQYGQLANSRIWDGLFPGGKHDPAELFGLDGQAGPKFVAVHSGTTFASTGHLAHLITRMAREKEGAHTVPGRRTNPATVTIIELPAEPPKLVCPPLSSRLSGSVFFAIIPIAVSWGACIVCALMGDWFSFAAILSGIVANGWACFVIGSGKLTFTHPAQTVGLPPGDGFLLDNRNIVVLKGPENAVNSFTQGRFFLQYRGQREGEWEIQAAHEPTKHVESPDRALDEEIEALLDREDEEVAIRLTGEHPRQEDKEKLRESTDDGEKAGPGSVGIDQLSYDPAKRPETSSVREHLDILLNPTKRSIGFASFLLTVQFLAQLLLIPQGQLFGQLMFVATLATSWVYNSYLSSLDREDIQTTILLDIMGLEKGGSIEKYHLSSWTATVVFTYLSLQPDDRSLSIQNPRKILDGLVPNDTEVWEAWKRAVEAKFSAKRHLEFTKADWNLGYLRDKDRELLRLLLKDAMMAGRAWDSVYSK